MDSSEVERRFDLAVAGFRREVERRGIYSEGRGPARSFGRSKIFSDSLLRSLEGALSRCCYVPVVSVTLKDGFHFDEEAFGTCVDKQRYIEVDYIGIADNDLIVAAHVWSDNAFQIVLRAIPLRAIREIGVLYEEDLSRRCAA